MVSKSARSPSRIRPFAAATARLSAEERLRESNRQLRQLWGALQNIREEERRRIARELHDELGQQLTALKLDLSRLEGDLKKSGSDLCEKAAGMKRRMDATIKSVRRICDELRPALLDDLGLGAAIEWLAEDFAKRTGTEVVLDLADVDLARDGAMATALFRIVQECLTNIAKHAQATQARISLHCGNSGLELRVGDNGTGIAPLRMVDGESRGLAGIRERADMLGGYAEISFLAGKGTTVLVSLPLVSDNGPAHEQN